MAASRGREGVMELAEEGEDHVVVGVDEAPKEKERDGERICRLPKGRWRTFDHHPLVGERSPLFSARL